MRQGQNRQALKHNAPVRHKTKRQSFKGTRLMRGWQIPGDENENQAQVGREAENQTHRY